MIDFIKKFIYKYHVTIGFWLMIWFILACAIDKVITHTAIPTTIPTQVKMSVLWNRNDALQDKTEEGILKDHLIAFRDMHLPNNK